MLSTSNVFHSQTCRIFPTITRTQVGSSFQSPFSQTSFSSTWIDYIHHWCHNYYSKIPPITLLIQSSSKSISCTPSYCTNHAIPSFYKCLRSKLVTSYPSMAALPSGTTKRHCLHLPTAERKCKSAYTSWTSDSNDQRDRIQPRYYINVRLLFIYYFSMAIVCSSKLRITSHLY